MDIVRDRDGGLNRQLDLSLKVVLDSFLSVLFEVIYVQERGEVQFGSYEVRQVSAQLLATIIVQPQLYSDCGPRVCIDAIDLNPFNV